MAQSERMSAGTPFPLCSTVLGCTLCALAATVYPRVAVPAQSKVTRVLDSGRQSFLALIYSH